MSRASSGACMSSLSLGILKAHAFNCLPRQVEPCRVLDRPLRLRREKSLQRLPVFSCLLEEFDDVHPGARIAEGGRMRPTSTPASAGGFPVEQRSSDYQQETPVRTGWARSASFC